MKNRPPNKPSVEIQPLDPQFLTKLIRIHQTTLGYTLNSQLGEEHLAFMYQQMSQNAQSMVRVALISGNPIGLISGTIDLDRMKTSLFKALKPAQTFRIIIRLIQHPVLLREYYNSSLIGRPVQVHGKPIDAILTTVAVDPEFQGQGIGVKLVQALESFFKDQKIQAYRLDTLISNQPARKFYKKLGFVELENRRDSVVLIKELKNAHDQN